MLHEVLNTMTWPVAFMWPKKKVNHNLVKHI